MSKLITSENYRRFGIEIELNTTSNIIKSKDQVPDGSEIVAKIIQDVCNDDVSLNGWLYVNNNDSWVIKPDSTCGIEINSPILKGGFDLIKLCKIVEQLSKHPEITADERCSFHVHINVEDLSTYQIGTVLAWWIKCESVFFDCVPSQRKCHRHAQLIGTSDLFEHNLNHDSDYLIESLSLVKYYSVNVYHLRQKRRKAIEFRIAGNEFCLNPIFVKNWIRLLLHFVTSAVNKDYPDKYISGNSWTGLLSLSPKEVFEFLKFDKSNLSKAVQQNRQWFLEQLQRNTGQSSIGVWRPELRRPGMKEIRSLIQEYPLTNQDQDQNTLLYGKEFYI